MKNGQLPLSDDLVAAAKPATREYNLRDTVLRGLSLRVLPSGGKRWMMRLWVKGRARRVTLGDARWMSVVDARAEAHALLGGGKIETPKTKPRGPNFEAFAKTYWSRRAPSWKPSTQRSQRAYLRSTLLPFFGEMPMDGIATGDVARWFHDYSAVRPGGANRALSILRDMFNRARDWGLVPEHMVNPCKGMIQNRSLPRGRILNREDLRRLGTTLDRYALIRMDQVDAIRLILLTGCRSGEVLGLRWDEVQVDRLTLNDSKSGPRHVLLGEPASAILRRRRWKRHSAYVFPRKGDPSRSRVSISAFWYRLRAEAGLADEVRLHDLRHTFASHAVMQGETLMITGKLLGHRHAATTERYAHLADRFLLDAAERVAEEIFHR
ncbi:MAG: tyrosine-type recombinase/integrase, partial [Nitrospirota bacterium]|nr:tyrosine-type recombinase/integrase [Nitrospirota bacterium]